MENVALDKKWSGKSCSIVSRSLSTSCEFQRIFRIDLAINHQSQRMADLGFRGPFILGLWGLGGWCGGRSRYVEE